MIGKLRSGARLRRGLFPPRRRAKLPTHGAKVTARCELRGKDTSNLPFHREPPTRRHLYLNQCIYYFVTSRLPGLHTVNMAHRRPPNMCRRFEEKLNEIIPSERKRGIVFTPQEYFDMIEAVKSIKQSQVKSVEDILRLRCYDVVNVGSQERLCMPSIPPDPVKYYVHTQEIFNILYDIHANTDHGQLNKMQTLTRQRYKNISKKMITTFIETCDTCERKNRSEFIWKSVMESHLESRGQVDFVDMTLFNDAYHKFMLIYRDQTTKFILLRPLMNLDIIEMANILVDIFAMFGAPSVLQSLQNRFFLDNLIKEINGIWPQLTILHGRIKNPRFEPYLELNSFDEVQEFVKSWYEENPRTMLAEAIRFAQLMINRIQSHHLACSPFETMFRKRMQFGLPQVLWERIPDGLRAEEDVEEYIDTNFENA